MTVQRAFYAATEVKRSDMPKKPNTVQIKLVSEAGTGYFYTTFKNPRNTTEKMAMRKYDPVARKHVMFKESKIK